MPRKTNLSLILPFLFILLASCDRDRAPAAMRASPPATVAIACTAQMQAAGDSVKTVLASNEKDGALAQCKTLEDSLGPSAEGCLASDGKTVNYVAELKACSDLEIAATTNPAVVPEAPPPPTPHPEVTPAVTEPPKPKVTETPLPPAVAPSPMATPSPIATPVAPTPTATPVAPAATPSPAETAAPAPAASPSPSPAPTPTPAPLLDVGSVTKLASSPIVWAKSLNRAGEIRFLSEDHALVRFYDADTDTSKDETVAVSDLLTAADTAQLNLCDQQQNINSKTLVSGEGATVYRLVAVFSNGKAVVEPQRISHRSWYDYSRGFDLVPGQEQILDEKAIKGAEVKCLNKICEGQTIKAKPKLAAKADGYGSAGYVVDKIFCDGTLVVQAYNGMDPYRALIYSMSEFSEP